MNKSGRKHESYKRGKAKSRKAWKRNAEKQVREQIYNRNERANARAAELARAATSAEKRFMWILDSANIVYKFQRPIVAKSRRYCVVDFWFPRGKRVPLVVEIDGGYHDTPEQRRKDKEREELIRRETGADILRFTNEAVFSDADAILRTLADRCVLTMKAVQFTF